MWDVAHRDPYSAVVAKLTAPPDFIPQPEPVSGVIDRVPRAMFMSHGPFARDPAAIALIKERESGDRRLYAVSFDDFEDNRWFWLVAAKRRDAGWIAHAWLAGVTDRTGENAERSDRPRARDLVRG
jgi:hypothetical protein